MDEPDGRERLINPTLLALIGALILGLGVIAWKSWGSDTKVEVISGPGELVNQTSSEPEKLADIVIEVAGSVEKPGVYKLPRSSRVEDALVVAGGLSAQADRDWLSKYVNRAKVLVDGEKVYIPGVGEMGKIAEEGITTIGQEMAGVSVESNGLININSASQAQLEDLWGVGEVTAKKIIDSRPYSSVDELISRKILKKNVFEKISNQLAVY